MSFLELSARLTPADGAGELGIACQAMRKAPIAAIR